jgi:hypothetical protein
MTNDLNINDELDETVDDVAEEAAPKKRGRPKADEAKSDVKKIAVTVKRDFWNAEGERQRKGTVVELSVEEAMDAVESGAATRVRG